jgi:hypothetical protein
LRSVEKRDLLDAIAWLTIPALIGPVIGPPVGGYITTVYDWRWIFWMNLPFGLIAFGLASWLMPNIKAAETPPLDVKGFLLSGAGLTLSVFGLTVVGRGMFTDAGGGDDRRRAGAAGGLCGPRAQGGGADPRSQADAHPDLPPFGAGRQPVPHRGGGGALHHAADAAAGLRLFRLCQRHDHLCLGAGGGADEVLGGAHRAPLRLPQPADRQRRCCAARCSR